MHFCNGLPNWKCLVLYCTKKVVCFVCFWCFFFWCCFCIAPLKIGSDTSCNKRRQVIIHATKGDNWHEMSDIFSGKNMKNIIQLFHACLWNSQGAIVHRAVHGTEGSSFVYSPKQPWNNCFITQLMLEHYWFSQWALLELAWDVGMSTLFPWKLTSPTEV